MADSGSSGTPVSLVIPAQPAHPITVVHRQPPPASHLPFTGLDAVTAIALAFLLVVAGVLLLITGRRPSPRRI